MLGLITRHVVALDDVRRTTKDELFLGFGIWTNYWDYIFRQNGVETKITSQDEPTLLSAQSSASQAMLLEPSDPNSWRDRFSFPLAETENSGPNSSRDF